MSTEILEGGFIGSEVERRLATERGGLTPPLPPKIAIEINNSCNHECYFCPNPTMVRPRRVIDDEVLYRIMRDAHDNGIRELSFYSTGEPFLNKKLPEYVRRAKDLGFSYVFLSTNGGRATTARIPEVLEAGLDSLKFSINAGNRESYALVHGVDEFEEVIANVERVARFRREKRPAMKLFVSFVETALNRDDFEALKARLGPLVDEVVRYPFCVIGTPLKRRVGRDGTPRPFVSYPDVDSSDALNVARTEAPCIQLWSYLNVTVEGYLSACCSDFNDDLIVGNLNRTGLLEAWHSPEFRDLRQRHLAGRIEGTLCAGCVAQRELPHEPLNPHLMTPEQPQAGSPASPRDRRGPRIPASRPTD